MLYLIYLLQISSFFKRIKWKGFTGPVIILIILFMMILPLSSFILDIFFTFNIVISIIILLVAMFIRNTLEFSVFPTVVLFATLFRLSLNIASTRVILLNGHVGTFAAGHVVEAFGHFLVGGDLSIGIILFSILVIINFIVITKGAGRIAEVGARFALDGMHTKQMSIDSDFNAGLINDQKARILRSEVAQESDFYGSMDGASKFVRGDAIAGILIMIINIIGGLIIGIFKYNMQLYEASRVYTLLTIGDGLVAQIPALVISTATGVIVTRVNTNQNVSEQIINQMFYNPQVIFLTGLVLGILGLMPGMPNSIFLFFTCSLLIIAYFLYNLQNEKVNVSITQSYMDKLNNQYVDDLSWNDVELEDFIRLEIGNFLGPMLSLENNNNLFYQISIIRSNFAKKNGFLPPIIYVKHKNQSLNSKYKIFIKGVEYGSGQVMMNKLIAIRTKDTLKDLPYPKVTEPVFQLPAYWINYEDQAYVKKQKYNIIHPESVIITHIDYLMLLNLKNLFGRQQAKQLLDYILSKIPKLVEELTPNCISLTCFHKVLRNLLSENIPIRDVNTIIETLIEYAPMNYNYNELTSLVRLSLSKLITQTFFYKQNKVCVIGLSKTLEIRLTNIVQSGKNVIDSKLRKIILQNTKKAINRQKEMNLPIVLLVKHILRFFIFSFIRKYFSELIILSKLEISYKKTIIIQNIIDCDN
ncbi:Flagellar biosynthesis protein FlhA [Buchnera aphidicola (Pterocallis alni)]|uniref:FHIPEP family type III secretion protein n=1 Tax=Buchnera aphidicola TaxID=9 RepID=UPI00346411F8